MLQIFFLMTRRNLGKMKTVKEEMKEYGELSIVIENQ